MEAKPIKRQRHRGTVWGKAAYRSRMDALIELLGGKCAACGSDKRLEIDHIQPRTWDPAKLSRWQRAKRYLEEAKAGGIVQLLCRRCNAQKGKPSLGEKDEPV